MVSKQNLKNLLGCDTKNEFGPQYDLCSGSTRKISFEAEVISSTRLLRMFRVLDILPQEVTFHVYVCD